MSVCVCVCEEDMAKKCYCTCTEGGLREGALHSIQQIIHSVGSKMAEFLEEDCSA